MKKLNLMFHGFPGPVNRSTQSSIYLRDGLARLFRSREEDFVYCSYPGILVPGYFTFTGALEYSCSALEKNLKNYDEINLIGHSFGGMVVLYCLSQLLETAKIKSLTLVTPLLNHRPREQNRMFLERVFINAPRVLDPLKMEQYLDDSEELEKRFDAFKDSKNLENLPIKIIGATRDMLTPKNFAEKFAQQVGASYFEIDAEHSLTNENVLEIIKLL